MKTDLTEIKRQLRTFLERRGVAYDAHRKAWKCPQHDDATPSAVLYENPDGSILHCPVCKASGLRHNWDIFGVCELLDGCPDFKDKLSRVRQTLGIAEPEPKRKAPAPVVLPLDKAREVYTEAAIDAIATEKGWGSRTGVWKYEYPDGIHGVDVRFERSGEKKTVLTFWWDGERLRWSGGPVFIYNLMEAVNDTGNRPVLIHEGAKCADAARVLADFVSVSWSGGSGKADLADWSVLSGREIYLCPDDDVPGFKAVRAIATALPGSKIIRPVEAARALKKKGADIVEILQVLSPDEFTAYALDPANHMDVSELGLENNLQGATPVNGGSPAAGSGPSSEPFKILGIGDDGRAAFITAEGRLVKFGLDTIGKSRLTVLAGHTWWEHEYPKKGGVDWDAATDDIVRRSQSLDFYDDNVRGRGAWRDGDKISYHDGLKTSGDWDDKIIYLRLSRHDIGLDDEPAPSGLCRKIKDIVFRLSFETRADALRCLGWAALAPFAGALRYRPAILLTGSSGSGKSTVQEIVLKNLTDYIWCDTKETSTAGVRSRIGRDSTCVFFEEGDKTTQKMKMNVDDILAFVRSNYTSNSPDAFKGTKEGGWVNYKMNSIFGIASIDPTVENIADENRIFRINMVKPANSGEWKAIERELIALLSPGNCRSIRALTWRKLRQIFDLTETVIDKIRAMTSRDYRSSYAEALLVSAFMVVWSGIEAPTEEQVESTLRDYYDFQPAETHRNEAEELVDSILDQTIEILHDHRREKLTIMMCLNKIYEHALKRPEEVSASDAVEAANYRTALCGHGLNLTGEFDVAIRNNHHYIKRVIERGHGYSKILKRHPGCIGEHATVYFQADKRAMKCTVLRDILKKPEPEPAKPKTPDEELEALFD